MSFTGLYEKCSKIKGFSAAGILTKVGSDNEPQSAHKVVKWAVDSGIIKGDGSGLNLDDKDLRYITILYRLNG